MISSLLRLILFCIYVGFSVWAMNALIDNSIAPYFTIPSFMFLLLLPPVLHRHIR